MVKVCVVVASRANYGRVKHALKHMDARDDIDLSIIVGASAVLDRYGRVDRIAQNDGLRIARKLYYLVEGETLVTQAKSTGLGIIELASIFEEINPDFVLTVADRFETVSTAIAASYMNIPLIHLQGGDVSGNIDDKVRNSVTMLSDFHFPASKTSAERLIKMGIDPGKIFLTGCPSMDVLKHDLPAITVEQLSEYKGVGACVEWTKPYVLIVQHPVTTSYGEGRSQITRTLEAVSELSDYQKVVLWPNSDAGSEDVSKGIRVFREFNSGDDFTFFKNFPPEIYAKVLEGASCAVGNSSSFIREGLFLGTPAVLVGDRQRGREIGDNVKFVDYDRNNIKTGLVDQLRSGRYAPDYRFGDGDSGERIAALVASFGNQ